MAEKACDIYGREFQLKVDAEHKATELKICNLSKPHMRAFHTSWFGFFSSFFSTFAAAPLMAYIRKGTSVGLSKSEIGTSGLMAVLFTIFFRLAMGVICDKFGARKGLSILLLCASPAVLGMMAVPACTEADTVNGGCVDKSGASAFIACRAIIGTSLATFVACQTWCAQQFSKNVVGVANATAAGWGNLGGGVTNLTMPLIFLGMLSASQGYDNPQDRAWRLCYIVPFLFHIVSGLAALTARDLPDGNFSELESSGAKQKSRADIVVKVGFSNVNAWVLTLTYGMCFGIELTMNNIAALYFMDYHGLSPGVAGAFASAFGMMNLFARSLGGILSDVCNKKWGLRGRLWSTWIIQTLEGFLCVLMGSLTLALKSPDDPDMLATTITGHTLIGGTWTPMPDWAEGGKITMCSTIPVATDAALREHLNLPASAIQIQVTTPPSSVIPGGDDCISSQGLGGLCLFSMIIFSLFVQMAEGLHYGVVPYVSRTALGVVSGMVGAGGNAGCVVSMSLFFKGQMRTDVGIFSMGWMIIGVTALMFFVYLPEHGGMLIPAGGLGSWDPQIIKPPSDYRGADQMDYAAAKTPAVEIKKEEAQVETSKA